MPLSPGDKLGPYEILSAIGAGGMGEVYKARDTRLDRTVAVKVSKADFTQRFEREARAIAALNHPNICQLYDVGHNYLVMEFIEGTPLAGPLPVEKVVEYAGQILDALDAAHRKGFTHRDLKPANILVTRHGIKLLDFGLAKQRAPLGDSDATMLAGLSQPGEIAGTLHYMAPEQLQGKEADARSDLFAFGCLLYELLSGNRAFAGESVASVIAAILEREPSPLALAPPLDRVIQTCLAKNPDNRFQNAVDLKRALQWATEPRREPEAAAPVPQRQQQPQRRWRLAAASAIGLIAGYALFPTLWTQPPDTSNLRLTPFATNSDEDHNPRWSPDGNSLAYVQTFEGMRRVVVRGLESPTPVVLSPAGCTADAQAPFWSPDGREVFYRCAEGVFASPAVGGDPRLVLKASFLTAADISPDGKTLAVIKGPAFQVFLSSPVGSPLKAYPRADYQNMSDTSSSSSDYLRYSRDGRSFYSRGQIFDASGETAVRRIGFSNWAAWTPGDKALVKPIRGPGRPFGLAAIDPRTGSATNLLLSLTVGINAVDISPNGKRFAVAFGSTDDDIVELPVDGGAIRSLLATSRSEANPRWLPQQNALVYATNREGVLSIWARELQGRWERPIVREIKRGDPRNLGLTVSPDGTRVGYLTHNRQRMWLAPVNGGTPIQIHQAGPQETFQRADWSPDGQWLVFDSLVAGTRKLVKMRVGANQPPVTITEGIRSFRYRWSPDGNWIATLKSAQAAQTRDERASNSPIPPGRGDSVGRDFTNRERLLLVSPDGKVERDLGPANARSCAAWSKDSRMIYLVEPYHGQHRLRVFDAAGTSPAEKLIAIYPASARLNQLSGCELSPDGKTIAANRLNVTSNIWILDGLELTRSWWSRLFPRGASPLGIDSPEEEPSQTR